MARKRFDTAPEIRIGSDSLLLAVQAGSSSNILEIKDSSNNTIFTIDNNGSIPNLAVNGSSLVFEGATADSYELTLQATDPTADRTITLPDATTTIVGTDTSDTLTNKTISSGTLTGTLTVGGSVGTNGQVLQSTGSGIQWATAAGSGTVTSITAGTGLSGGTITTSGTISIDSTVVTLSGTQSLSNKTLTNAIIETASTTTVPLTIKQIASQFSNLVEFVDSSSNVMSKVDYAGTFWSQYSIIGNFVGYAAGTTLSVNAISSSTAAIIAKGASGQSSNLLEIQNSSGTVLAKIAADGVITSSSNIIGHIATNAQTSSYTLVLSDDGKLIEINNSSANTLTVPLNDSVAFPIGTQITILQTGSGQTTITPASGVTINATPGLKLRAQWSSVTLIKRGTNTWVALGDLQA